MPRRLLPALLLIAALALSAACGPRRQPLPEAGSVGAVAVASSDLGLRWDPKSPGELLVFEPRYEPDGEEKLLPPRRGHSPLPPGFVPLAASKSSRVIIARFRDDLGRTASARAELSADGRSAEETWTIPATISPLPFPLPSDLRVTRRGESGVILARSWRATLPALPPVARPGGSIVIRSSDVADDRAATTMLGDLGDAVHPRLRRSIAPFGLTNDLYFGHVFWDADVWVFPALALLDPDAAAEIPRYRLRRLPQAEQNFAAWLAEGRPTARGKLGGSGQMAKGAMFPWESSESGKETVPGDSRFEHHVTGSVAWSVSLAADLGLVDAAQARQLVAEAGAFYRARREGTHIRAVVSPDETHTGDDDLYTNLLADWTIAGGHHPKAPTLSLPKDKESFLAYTNDPVRGYKQAAALLAVYPLQFPPAEAQAATMLRRFAPKVTPNGPAMSHAIHAIVAARSGDPDEGLRYWRKSWEGFLDPRSNMYSEKRRSRREDFLTGEAGCIQALLYGFAGVRIGEPRPGDRVLLKLRRGKVLSCTPHLPSAWRSLEVRGLTVLGRRYDLRVDRSGERLTASP